MAKKENKQVVDFPFGKENYMWMLIGIALIFFGFVLMAGGGSEDPTVWDPAVLSARRITIAPIIVMAGFVVEIYAIVKKVKD
jgi:hypothetical protein